MIPTEGVVLEHLGDIWEAEGNEQKAREYWQKALGGELEDRDRKRIQKKLGNG